MGKYIFLSITEIGEAIKSKKVSPVELVIECLAMIEQVNPSVNAFITVATNEAMHQAKIAEREINSGQWRGPLHGIPIGIKDFYDTAGMKTTAAFEPFKNRIPNKDAVVVKKLKEAGAIIIGKTNMHVLGMGTTSTTSFFGSVHNPWKIDYVAGGSSGGSAAAVAMGLCFATVDTDAVGSCRLPAACCGVNGFKPTFGLISGKGILEGQPADEGIIKFAHAGITTRAVKDTALLLNVLTDNNGIRNELKFDYSTTFEINKKYKIGIVKNFKATKEVKEKFFEAIGTFETLGHPLFDIEVPFDEATFNISNVDRDRQTINKYLFNDVDAILLPTTTMVTPTIEGALEIGDEAVSADNTFFCNYYGLPAISIPSGFDGNKLPLGLQIVGPQWGEGVVLNLADTFQSQEGWHLLNPIHP